MPRPDSLTPAPGTELDHNTPWKSTLRWFFTHAAMPVLPIAALTVKDWWLQMETVTGVEGFARNAATITLISVAGDVLGRRGVVPFMGAIAATAGAVAVSAEFDIGSLLRQDSFPTSVENGLNEWLILATYALTGINSYIAKNRGDGIAAFTVAKVLRTTGNLIGRGLNSFLKTNDNDY